MTTSEILKAARARLTPETWGQGGLTDGVRECAIGAIGGAYFGHARTLEHFRDVALIEAVNLVGLVATGRKVVPIWYLHSLGDWNDRPERTFQDVMDAFDAAIAIAEQHEQDASVAMPHALEEA